jgi:hypothetical protein
VRKDLIFPFVIKATDYFSKPLGTWYLYTGPHNHSGQVLYYSNSLTGPWKLHGRVADGVAACVFWKKEEKKLYMISHVMNHDNRVWASSDGIKFARISKMLGVADQPHGYAKVWEYTLPGDSNRFIMLAYKDNDCMCSCMLKSNDGITWKYVDEHRFMPHAPYPRAGNPFYIEYGGARYVLVHEDTEPVYAYEVDAGFTPKRFIDTIVDASVLPKNAYSVDGQDNTCLYGYPFIVESAESLYLFMSIGCSNKGSKALVLLAAQKDGDATSAALRPIFAARPAHNLPSSAHIYTVAGKRVGTQPYSRGVFSSPAHGLYRGFYIVSPHNARMQTMPARTLMTVR